MTVEAPAGTAAPDARKAGKPAEKVKPGSGVQAPKDGASTVIRR